MKRPGRKSLRDTIDKAGGIIAAVARHYEVERQTVYRWLDYYGMHDAIRDARDDIIDIAEANLFRAVRSGDTDVSKFVLTRLGRGRGWGNSVEVSGVMIPPEIVRMVEELGGDATSIVREFEAMIRAQAEIAQQGANDAQSD